MVARVAQAYAYTALDVITIWLRVNQKWQCYEKGKDLILVRKNVRIKMNRDDFCKVFEIIDDAEE